MVESARQRNGEEKEGKMEREREKQRGKKRCEKNPLLLVR